MRRAATAGLLLCAACASTPPPAVPPVVMLPTPPAATATSSATGSAISTATPTGTASGSAAATTPPWIARVERREKTQRVAACQVGPFTFGSTLVVENRPLAPGRIAVRVTEDDESGAGVTALPSLLGKGYVVTAGPKGIDVRGENGRSVAADEAARVASVASAFLAWPGADVAAHLPGAGAEVAALEGPVGAVAGVPVHGGPAQVTKAAVRYAGTRAADAGDELAFDVTLNATEGDAGMCHAWTNTATATGELRTTAAGAFRSLHVEGGTGDTEAVCQGAGGGKPPRPTTCDKGDVRVDVTAPHAP